MDQQTGVWNTPYKFSGKEKDDETGYSYFGARYYDSDLSVWLSVDPMAGKYPEVSPYCYVGNRPINVVDPDGADEIEVIRRRNGKVQHHRMSKQGGNEVQIINYSYENEKGEHIQSREPYAFVGTKKQLKESIDNSSAWRNAAIAPSTSSTASNTSSSSSNNPVQTVNNVNNYAGIVVSAAQGTVQSTPVGANFAYAISGNSKVVNDVSNTFKYAPYAGLLITTGAGYYLSTHVDPATNKPYQSWAETGVDIGANMGAIYIGTQYGGWWGAAAAAAYVLDKAAFKAYIKTCTKHPEYYQGIPKHP